MTNSSIFTDTLIDANLCYSEALVEALLVQVLSRVTALPLPLNIKKIIPSSLHMKQLTENNDGPIDVC